MAEKVAGLSLHTEPGWGVVLGMRLWDAGVTMANFFSWMEDQGHSFCNRVTLELGSGTGVVGLKLASLGANVTLTDYQPAVLQLLERNIHENNLQERTSVHLLDWSNPATYLANGQPITPARSDELPTFDLILAGDCVYDVAAEQPLAATLAAHVTEGSNVEVLLSFKQREQLSTGRGLFEMLASLGFHMERLEDGIGRAVGGKNSGSFTDGRFVELPPDAATAVQRARFHPDGDLVQVFRLTRPCRKFSIIGSWCDWKEWGEMKRSDGGSICKRTLHVRGGQLEEFQIGIDRDWNRVLYPMSTPTGEVVTGGPGVAHGINWQVEVPKDIELCEVSVDTNATPKPRVSWKLLQHMPMWEVVQNLGRGVLVRSSCSLSSEPLGRLSEGAMVEELELEGNRLHYRKISGDGPGDGWVSITFRGKGLLRREQEPDAVQASDQIINRISAQLVELESKIARDHAAVSQAILEGQEPEYFKALSQGASHYFFVGSVQFTTR